MVTKAQARVQGNRVRTDSTAHFGKGFETVGSRGNANQYRSSGCRSSFSLPGVVSRRKDIVTDSSRPVDIHLRIARGLRDIHEDRCRWNEATSQCRSAPCGQGSRLLSSATTVAEQARTGTSLLTFIESRLTGCDAMVRSRLGDSTRTLSTCSKDQLPF